MKIRDALIAIDAKEREAMRTPVKLSDAQRRALLKCEDSRLPFFVHGDCTLNTVFALVRRGLWKLHMRSSRGVYVLTCDGRSERARLLKEMSK